MIRALIATILAGLFVFVSMTAALAHASLLTTTPANNAVVAAAPRSMEMTFNEPVGALSFTLVGPGGQTRDLTAAAHGGVIVSVTMPADLSTGTEALNWHVVSADGHPVGGTLVFSVGAVTGGAEEATTDRTLVIAIWLARVLVYVGLFVGAGGLAFGAVAALPPVVKRINASLVGVGTIAALLSIGLQGADGLGLTLAGIFDPQAWVTGWSTTHALTVEAVLLAYALAGVLLMFPGQRLLAGLVLLVIGLSLSLSGHASAADPQWLTRPAVFVHVTAVCFWIGSLLPLSILLLQGGPAAEAALERFSAMIPLALFPLVIAGGVLVIVQLGPAGPSWLTPYAAILAGKLVLVLALFLLAAWNRWRLTGSVRSGEVRGQQRLVLSIRVELVLAFAILGLVAGWRFTVPPRAIAKELAAPVSGEALGGSLMAELSVSPGRVGETSISVDLMDGNMAPVKPLSVKLSLTQETAGVGPIEADAAKGQDGLWHADRVTLPEGGTWTVSIDARTGTFDITTLTGSFTLPSSTESPVNNPRSVASAAVLASSMLVPASALASPGIVASCPTGQTFTQGAITVSGAYVRATLKGAQSAGAYLTLSNSGSTADSFTGATSPAAHDIGIHQMKMNGQVMEMSPVESLEIPAGGSVSIDPMSYHLMITGMEQPFQQGGCVEMTLHFAKAGDLPIELNIGSIAQREPPRETPAGASSAEDDMAGMAGMSSANP